MDYKNHPEEPLNRDEKSTECENVGNNASVQSCSFCGSRNYSFANQTENLNCGAVFLAPSISRQFIPMSYIYSHMSLPLNLGPCNMQGKTTTSEPTLNGSHPHCSDAKHPQQHIPRQCCCLSWPHFIPLVPLYTHGLIPMHPCSYFVPVPNNQCVNKNTNMDEQIIRLSKPEDDFQDSYHETPQTQANSGRSINADKYFESKDWGIINNQEQGVVGDMSSFDSRSADNGQDSSQESNKTSATVILQDSQRTPVEAEDGSGACLFSSPAGSQMKISDEARDLSTPPMCSAKSQRNSSPEKPRKTRYQSLTTVSPSRAMEGDERRAQDLIRDLMERMGESSAESTTPVESDCRGETGDSGRTSSDSKRPATATDEVAVRLKDAKQDNLTAMDWEEIQMIFKEEKSGSPDDYPAAYEKWKQQLKNGSLKQEDEIDEQQTVGRKRISRIDEGARTVRSSIRMRRKEDDAKKRWVL